MGKTGSNDGLLEASSVTHTDGAIDQSREIETNAGPWLIGPIDMGDDAARLPWKGVIAN
jgi:hypothetical protein